MTISASAAGAREAARSNDGRFGEQEHGEPAGVALSTGSTPSTESFVRQREQGRDRMLRVWQQVERLEHINQLQSVQIIASHLLASHPKAATLTIRENDGNGGYWFGDVRAADGSMLLDGDDGWAEDQVAADEDLESVILELSTHNDSWAEGIATDRTNRHDGKKFEIDLRKAVAQPLPVYEEELSPRTKTLSAEEQDDLVEAAFWGISDLEDSVEKLDDHEVRTDRERHLERLSELLQNRQSR